MTITAGNIGGDDAHELVIVRGDDPDSLPVADGKVAEDELPDGDYIFFCNLVEEESDGTIESHFEEGMRTVVTVG